MTVCIAGISAPQIITVSDMMMSDDFSSLDGAAIKVDLLANAGQWSCMYSGLPSQAHRLKRDLRRYLKKNNITAPLLSDMTDAVEFAYAESLRHRSESETLAPFGMTLKEFIKTGLTRFGEKLFHELASEIRSLRIDTELLVTGFDPDEQPHLFATSNLSLKSGTCTIYDSVGFHAIGAGAWAALGSLFGHLKKGDDQDTVCYRLCEAKFVAETARSVGVATIMVIFNEQHNLHFGVDDVVRQAWEEQRQIPIPKEALDWLGRTRAHLHPVAY